MKMRFIASYTCLFYATVVYMHSAVDLLGTVRGGVMDDNGNDIRVA